MFSAAFAQICRPAAKTGSESAKLWSDYSAMNGRSLFRKNWIMTRNVLNSYYELRSDQFHPITTTLQLPGPMVRRCTGLQSNLGTDRHTLAQRIEPFLSRIIALPANLVMAINTMNMENRFCDIDTDSGNVHRGLSSSSGYGFRHRGASTPV